MFGYADMSFMSFLRGQACHSQLLRATVPSRWASAWTSERRISRERKGSKRVVKLRVFFRVLLGKPVAEGHFEKLWGDFLCGVNPELADHTR